MRNERILTCDDVQSLYAYFTKAGWPDNAFTSECYERQESSSDTSVEPRTPSLVQLYLPWLRDDRELALRVTDAWNAKVRRRTVGVEMSCHCIQCMTWTQEHAL